MKLFARKNKNAIKTLNDLTMSERIALVWSKMTDAEKEEYERIEYATGYGSDVLCAVWNEIVKEAR